MDMFRNSAGFEQKLLVTFRARSLDLKEIVEDVVAEIPSASFRCARTSPQADESGRGDVVDVGMELPDDATLLNSAMRVIFHAQDGLPPAIKVRRVLGERANDETPCPKQKAALAIAAAA